MLPAEHRLTGGDAFTLAVRSGDRAGGRGVVVHLARPEGGASAGVPARVGFIVSRAVGNAVVRNRVKRRLRHLMCERVDVLPAGAVVAVRALPASATRTAAELGADLDRCLSRMGVSPAASPGSPASETVSV